MPKLTMKAIRDGHTYPNYKKTKGYRMEGEDLLSFEEKNYSID